MALSLSSSFSKQQNVLLHALKNTAHHYEPAYEKAMFDNCSWKREEEGPIDVSGFFGRFFMFKNGKIVRSSRYLLKLRVNKSLSLVEVSNPAGTPIEHSSVFILLDSSSSIRRLVGELTCDDLYEVHKLVIEEYNKSREDYEEMFGRDDPFNWF